MLNPDHVRQFIIIPALGVLPEPMRQPNAEALLLGTALQESGLVYLKQGYETPSDGRGVALGLYQMEPTTYEDHLSWLQTQPDLRSIILPYGHRFPEEMQGDLYFATQMARVHYWNRAPDPIPAESDVEGMARYWGVYWQTQAIPESMAHFAELYQTYVL